MSNARKQELICSDCGQYESECKCQVTPPTDEGLRARVAREVCQFKHESPWEDCLKEEQDAAYRSADWILELVQQVIERDYVKKPKDRTRIVCLCGSGRFKEAFDKTEFDKTLSGEIVLTIGCNTHDIARDIDWQHVKPMLAELHKRKIDLCDYIFVVNVGGYIGDSTRSEIDYAIKTGKPVKYLEAV